MAIFANNVFLFAKLTVLCCLVLIYPSFISARQKPQLAAQVCRSTTDSNFCNQTIYSDPRAPTDDPVMLAYIVFGYAYLNSSNTQTQIQLKIAQGGDDDGLKSCLGHYTNATGALSQVLGNLDSDSYYRFDKLSIEAQSHVRDCEKSFNATTTGPSPMAKENADLIKLTDICYAVAQLFPYTD